MDAKLVFLKSQLKFPQSLYNKEKWDLTIKYIRELKKKSKILDVGFGYPFLEGFLKDEYQIFGVDNNKYFLKDLNKENYRYGDIRKKISFEDNYFDCVVMLEVIEHLNNTETSFREIKRVLKPEGLLLISTPNHNSVLWRLAERFYIPLFGKGYKNIKEHHINNYTSEKLYYETKKYFNNVKIIVFSLKMGLFSICRRR